MNPQPCMRQKIHCCTAPWWVGGGGALGGAARGYWLEEKCRLAGKTPPLRDRIPSGSGNPGQRCDSSGSKQAGEPSGGSLLSPGAPPPPLGRPRRASRSRCWVCRAKLSSMKRSGGGAARPWGGPSPKGSAPSVPLVSGGTLPPNACWPQMAPSLAGGGGTCWPVSHTTRFAPTEGS